MKRLDHRVGDSVRVCTDPKPHPKKTIRAIYATHLEVQDASGNPHVVPLDGVINRSLQARQSWSMHPKRGVGRRAIAGERREPVTLRIRPSIWERLGSLVAKGQIRSREAAVDHILEQYVTAMETAASSSLNGVGGAAG